MYFTKPILKSLSSISLSGRSPGTIRPLAKFFAFFFTIGQVAWNNQTTCKFLRILSSCRSPGTIRPLAKFFAFFFTIGHVVWNNQTTRKILCFLLHYWASCLEQLDHLRVFSHFHYQAGRLEQLNHLRVSSHFIIGQVAWNNQTTHKILCFLLHYRAGRLEQLDHLRVSSHFIIGQVAQNNQTTCEFPRILSSGDPIRPLASFLAFYHRAGHLEQLDHLQNSSYSSSISGRSLEAIRPLVKFFLFVL